MEVIHVDIDKKLKVFEVAKELFERFGFKKTNVDEIAARAGISKRTLYEMFGSKEKILSELVMYEGQTLSRQVRAEMRRIDDPLKQLQWFTITALAYFGQNPFLAKVLGDDSGLYAPFLQNEIRVIEEGIEEVFRDILERGTAMGIFRPMDVPASAHCIFVLFRSFTYAHTITPSQAWVQFILNAILKDGSSVNA